MTAPRLKQGARRGVLSFFILTLAACAGPGAGLYQGRSANLSAMGATSDSGNSNSNSGASSGDSGTANSGASSGNSAVASQDSANATADSVHNSDASSNDATRSSSEGTTRTLGPLFSTTSMAGTVIGLGFLLWSSIAAGAAGAAAVAPAVAAQLFLRANTHQLEQDLALGAGRSIEDLAAMAEIRPENLPRFGRMLRAHRSELLDLARPASLTPERAAEFMHRVGGIAATDPALFRDGQDFLVRHRDQG